MRHRLIPMALAAGASPALLTGTAKAATPAAGSGTTVRSHFQRDTRSGSTILGRRRAPRKR
jgi:hypothetical protein